MDSLAERYSLLLVRKYPLASPRIFFRRCRRLLPRLTLGMTTSLRWPDPRGPARRACRRRRSPGGSTAPHYFSTQSPQRLAEKNESNVYVLCVTLRSLRLKAILAQQHPPDVRCLARRHQGGSAQVPFPARGLLGQDVALERVEALHLAGGGELETLHGAPPALQLQPLLGLSHFSSLSEPPRTTAAAARAGRGSLGSLDP